MPLPPSGPRALPIEELQGLKAHKYASVGRSVIDAQLQPFWNWVVSLVPLWVAPNLLTGFGLLVNVLSSLYLVYHNPTMAPSATETPASCFIACAVGLFIYQTLDNIDGKQARRTNTANPLGELFDHGCDAISTVVVIVAYLTAIQAAPTGMVFWVAMIAISIYYVVHWECYVKGRLYFQVIDVTEAQWVIICAHLATAFFGQQMWSESIFGIQANYLVTIPTVVYASISGCIFFKRILEGGLGPEGTTVAETSVLSPMLPFVALVAGLYYLHDTPSFQQYPCILLLGGGCGTAKLTWKLIVGHMSRSSIAQFDTAHVVPLVYVFLTIVGLDSHTAMIACCAIWLIDLAAAAMRIVMDLCDFLDIECFRIPVIKA